MTMIERVAAALQARDPHWLGTWEQLHPDAQFRFRMDARAAIEAMRKPTEAMVSKSFVRTPQAYGVIGPIVWRAMIDEALRESTPADPARMGGKDGG